MNKRVNGKDLVNHVVVFLSVFAFAIYLTISAGPQLIYFFNNESGKGIVIANQDGVLKYKIPNYLNGQEKSFKRTIKNNSYMMGLNVDDEFRLSYLADFDIIYIEEADTKFKVFLSFIGLLMSYWGVYYYFLKVIGRHKEDVI